MDGRKKRAKKAHRRHQKEKEIARLVRAEENRSDVEAELESEEPTVMGGDASSSKDGGGRDIVATLVEHRKPTAKSASGGRDTERRDDVPMSRKHAVNLDAVNLSIAPPPIWEEWRP